MIFLSLTRLLLSTLHWGVDNLLLYHFMFRENSHLLTDYNVSYRLCYLNYHLSTVLMSIEEFFPIFKAFRSEMDLILRFFCIKCLIE